jgi:hypothetical protein
VRELVAGYGNRLVDPLPEQAREADKLPGSSHYIGVGPVFATGTKKDAAAPVGLALLDTWPQKSAFRMYHRRHKESNIAAVRSRARDDRNRVRYRRCGRHPGQGRRPAGRHGRKYRPVPVLTAGAERGILLIQTIEQGP